LHIQQITYNFQQPSTGTTKSTIHRKVATSKYSLQSVGTL